MNLDKIMWSEEHADTNNNIVCDSTYMKCPEQENLERHKVDCGLLRTGD